MPVFFYFRSINTSGNNSRTVEETKESQNLLEIGNVRVMNFEIWSLNVAGKLQGALTSDVLEHA